MGSVVAFDEQRNGAASFHALRPAEGFIEVGEFFEQAVLLLQRRDGFGAGGSRKYLIGHVVPRVVMVLMDAPWSARGVPSRMLTLWPGFRFRPGHKVAAVPADDRGGC